MFSSQYNIRCAAELFHEQDTNLKQHNNLEGNMCKHSAAQNIHDCQTWVSVSNSNQPNIAPKQTTSCSLTV